MARSKLFVETLVCAVLLTVVLGCTTTRQLTSTNPKDLVASIRVDDVAQIAKQDGTSLEFTVTRVSEEGVHGNGMYVPYAEIRTLSVVRASPLRTGLLVAMGVAVVYALEKYSDCGIFNWEEWCDED